MMQADSGSIGQTLYNRGKLARDNGQTDRAKMLWKEAVLEEPRNAQFQASLANLYTKEGDFLGAIPCWREAFKNSPSDARYANGLGGALRHANRHSEASTYFQKARELNPSNALYGQNLEECRQAQAAFGAAPQAPNPYASSQPRPEQQARQPDPRREAFRRRQEQLNRQPRPTVFDFGPDGSRQYDSTATQAARMRQARAKMRNMAAEQAHCDDGEHHIKRYAVDNMSMFPGYSPLMRRRGVPEAMYNEDVAYLKKISAEVAKGELQEIGACVVTCGVSLLAWCVTDSASAKFRKKLKTALADMNQRYAPYSIQWNYELVPQVGGFISYET